MKKVLLLFIVILITKISFSQIVSCDSAKYFGGKIISVKATVASTYETTGDKKSVVLNFGKAFPDQCFQAIIYEKDLSKFDNRPKEFFKDKTIVVHGKVKLTNGKPIIMISSPDQITDK